MISEEFKKEVFRVVRDIPIGKVATYGQIAALLGKKNGARQVGWVMRNCCDQGVPCHRVVFHDGSLCHGDAFLFSTHQKHLLLSENIVFCKSGKVDLDKCRWNKP